MWPSGNATPIQVSSLKLDAVIFNRVQQNNLKALIFHAPALLVPTLPRGNAYGKATTHGVPN